MTAGAAGSDASHESVPNWPKIEATVHHDGTAHVTISGARHRITAPDVDAARIKVLAKFTATAATLGRPVRVDVTDPDTTQWQLIVHPGGQVDEVPGTQRRKPKTPQAPQAPASPVPAGRAELTGPLTDGRPRRRWRLAAALALVAVAVIASAATYSATRASQDDRKAQPVTPGIQFLEPAPGATVGLYTTVRTTTQGLSPGRVIWALVDFGDPGRPGYFPQGPCINDGPTLTLCPKVQFGAAADHGKHMTLCAVLGTPQLDSRIYTFVTTYKTGQPGLDLDLSTYVHTPCIHVTRT